MLVRQLSTISPAMTLLAAVETTRLHRGAGLTGNRTALVRLRPVRVPHHTISDAGLIGGGQEPMPGEVPLPHHDDGRTVPRSPVQVPRTVSRRWRVRLAVAALGGVLSAGIVGAIILLPLGSRARPRFLALRQALG
jgi:magnesium chelatase family protein